MKIAQLKTMTLRELIEFTDALQRASSVKNGPAESGVLWNGNAIEEEAEELVVEILDDKVFRFEPGTWLEVSTDTMLAAASGTDWVDRAIGFLDFATAFLDAKPFANL